MDSVPRPETVHDIQFQRAAGDTCATRFSFPSLSAAAWTWLFIPWVLFMVVTLGFGIFVLYCLNPKFKRHADDWDREVRKFQTDLTDRLSTEGHSCA